MPRLSFLLPCAVVLGLASSASAAPPKQTAIDGQLRGKKAKKRGSLAAMKGRTIKVHGKNVKVGDVAKEAFADNAILLNEFKAARAGLLADPVVDDEVVELEHATAFTQTISVTVVQPEVVAKKSPRFKKFRKGKAKGKPTVSEITGSKAKAEFKKWKASLKKLPANDPLRKAAAKGDDALLRAVADGKGEITVTTTLILPKASPKLANGQILRPKTQAGGNGAFEFGQTEVIPGFGTGGGMPRDIDLIQPPKVDESGVAEYHAKFMTGWYEGDDWEWEKIWTFPSGSFTVRADAYYGIGLRAPVEVELEVKPAKIETFGERDAKSSYEVEIDARTLDAGSSFYKDAGVPSNEIDGGDELVLKAGFGVFWQFKALWGVVSVKGNVGKDFDWGKDFEPPYDNCGNNCGFDVWIPSSVTNSGIHVGSKKYFVSGEARAGFKLTGSGEIEVDYEAHYKKDVIRSTNKDTGKTRVSHHLKFDDRKEQEFTSQLPAMDKAGTKTYGFKISKPEYTWDLEVKPGIRGDIQIKAGSIVDRTLTIGPLWLGAATLKLGKVEFPTYDGSNRSYKVKPGEKTWKKPLNPQKNQAQPHSNFPKN